MSLSSFPSVHARVGLICAAAISLFAAAGPASAASFQMRELQFASYPGYSMTATGVLETSGASALVSDWNIKVTTRETLARYTRANTVNLSAGPLGSDGARITVGTSPDGMDDGGALFFRSPNPFLDLGVAPADFGSGHSPGGEAYYLSPFSFDALALGQPDGSDYVAAVARGTGGNVFDLVPLSFGGGAVLYGTITTNGATGTITAADISAWDITVEQVTEDVFDAGNSVQQASTLMLTPDGMDLTLANPDGYLRFVKGVAGGHLHALQLADFGSSAPRGGEAGYFQGRLAITTLPLGAPSGAWRITGADDVMRPVPAPSDVAMWVAGGLGLLLVRRRAAA